MTASREQSRLPAPEEVEAAIGIIGQMIHTHEKAFGGLSVVDQDSLRLIIDLLRRLAAPATGANDATTFLVAAIQAIREQYAPLEDGEAVMLDTLQDRVERRDTIKPDGAPATGAGEWMPIETAPKTGEFIWAYLYNAGVRLVRWMTPEECAEIEGGDPSDYDGTWVETNDTEDWHPKFWMSIEAVPLPPDEDIPAPPSIPDTGGFDPVAICKHGAPVGAPCVRCGQIAILDTGSKP